MKLILHKLTRISIKVLPWILAIIYLIGLIFSSLGIDLVILSYVGFTSLLPALFILLCSFTFEACIWHRLPLYFILINNILTYILWAVLKTIPMGWTIVLIVISLGLVAVLGAYFKNKYNEQIRHSKKLPNADN